MQQIRKSALVVSRKAASELPSSTLSGFTQSSAISNKCLVKLSTLTAEGNLSVLNIACEVRRSGSMIIDISRQRFI